MTLLSWITLVLAGLNADSEQLRAVARLHQVPVIIMEGIASVESGYSGRNDVVGTAGEIGRMQVKESTARVVGCSEPIRLDDYSYNIDCGATVLRFCQERYGEWPLAIRCYQGMAIPASTVKYLERVEREIGKQQLARLR